MKPKSFPVQKIIRLSVSLDAENRLRTDCLVIAEGMNFIFHRLTGKSLQIQSAIEEIGTTEVRVWKYKGKTPNHGKFKMELTSSSFHTGNGWHKELVCTISDQAAKELILDIKI